MSWPPADAGGFVALLRPSIDEASPLSWCAVALGLVYLIVFVTVRRTRRPPFWRLVVFVVGCAALWAVTGSELERYARALFSVFMFQQLTLMIFVPSLLVLGSPVRLLLAVPNLGPCRWIRVLALLLVRGSLVRVFLHPALNIGLFLAAYYGLFLTGAANWILRVPAGDALLEVVFLGAGLLFAVPVLGSGPLPRPVSHAERALDVFVEMALHAFFGVLIMVSKVLLVPAFAPSTLALGIDPLADQAVAGGLAWSYGEGPAVLTLLFVMERWFRSDTARSARADRGADTETEVELEAYNRRLSRLAEQDSRPESPKR